MTLVDDLKAARALVDTPDKWCKGHGRMTRRKWLFFEQHSYCTIGAIAVEPGGRLNTSRRAYFKMRDALERALPPGFANSFLVAFNDDESTTHADIMRLFDRAIDAATLSQQKEAT